MLGSIATRGTAEIDPYLMLAFMQKMKALGLVSHGPPIIHALTCCLLVDYFVGSAAYLEICVRPESHTR